MSTATTSLSTAFVSLPTSLPVSSSVTRSSLTNPLRSSITLRQTAYGRTGSLSTSRPRSTTTRYSYPTRTYRSSSSSSDSDYGPLSEGAWVAIGVVLFFVILSGCFSCCYLKQRRKERTKPRTSTTSESVAADIAAWDLATRERENTCQFVDGFRGARAFPKPPRRSSQPASTTAVPDSDGIIPPFIWQPHRDSGMTPDEADDRMERGDADAPPAYRPDGRAGDGEVVLGRGDPTTGRQLGRVVEE